MSCTTTTAMYLNVSTEICASASASRSGNTVTVSGTFTVTQGNSWNYNAIYAYVDGHTSWTRVKPYVQSGGTWSENFSFSFEDSGSGSPTYTAIFQVWNNAESGTVGNPASTTFSVSYPSGATTPPQPTVTLVQSYTYGAKFHVSGDYGTPSSASGRYIEAAILNQNTYGNTYRFNIASNTSSADITVTNSTYQGGGLTILPNKQYYYGGYINNTERNNSIVTGQFVTKPAAPTVSRQTLGADSAEFAWSVVADGGYRDKTISYSVNNGSFITIGTYSGSSARSGSETLTNLIPNSQNTFSVKNATVEGNEITELTFTTLPPTPTISANAESMSSVRINYQVPADGGALTKTIAYSLDGGTTWSQGATISSGDATSGSFTIDNLSPNQSYTVTIKIMTNAGAVTLEAITVSTMSDHFVMYGPQEGETITGVTGTIRAGGAGNVTAFDGTTFWNKVKNSVNSTAFSYLRVISPSGSDNTWYLYLSYTDGTPTQTIAQGLEREQLATYGITATVQQSDTNDYIDLTLVISPSGTYTATRISEFYGPVNGETARANKVYAPVKDPTLDPYIRAGGAGNIISVDADKLLFHIPPSRKQKDIAYIKFTAYPAMNGYKLEVYHTDSTSQYLLTAAALLPREIYNILGVQMKDPTVNIAVDYIDFPVGYKNRFKTKIVHQAFGHHDYGYGILTYFTDANHTQTNTVELSSYNLRRLSGYYSSTRQTWNVTINGVTISNKDIYGVILTNKVTSLPPYFLSGCEALNSPLKLPPTLTSISDSGEANGSAFLFACKNMLAPIDVGSLSPSIVKSITPHSFSASDANAPAYTIGMTIVGANRAEWLSAFPNQGALIYRKLIDGGY